MNTITLLLIIGLGFSIILVLGFELIGWILRLKAKPDCSKIKKGEFFIVKVGKEMIILKCCYNDPKMRIIYARNKALDELIIDYKNILG
jgi:hypothetical protein